MNIKRLHAWLGVGVLWSSAATIAGCTSDDSSPGTSGDGGTSDATTTDGAAPRADGSVVADATGADAQPAATEAGPDVGTDGPASDGAVSTLYTRLGGHDGIRAAVHAIVMAEVADPQIASYFFAQVSNPVPSTAPTVPQIEECLTNQLAQAAHGPESYPTTVSTIVTADGGLATVTLGDSGATLTDAGHATWLCRDMIAIHTPLHISGGTFDRFVTIAGATLTLLPNVSASDVMTLGGVLGGLKTQIVDTSLPDAGLECFPGPLPDGATPANCLAEAGSEAGPTDAGGQ